MSETIIVSLITGGITLIGVLISNSKHQAVVDTKLEELTREVREHNDFAKRIPVIESEIQHIKSNIQKLEKFHS